MTDALDTAMVASAVESAVAAASAPGDGSIVAPQELAAPLAALASSGKRLRARLLVTAYRAAGGIEMHRAHRLAAALELFQTAAVIHDDVLDHADTRRGLPAVHKAIEAAHASQAWAGDAPNFGMGGAILAGDLTLMACIGEIGAAVAGLDAATTAEVSDRFASLTSLCTVGQYLDLRLAANPPTADQARAAVEQVMRAKTASYTTVAPLALGAALACAPRDIVDAWAAAAEPLGLAFQLRDDLLGTVGDSRVTGKPTGDDIVEGKYTLLAAHVVAHGTGAEQAAFARAWGNAGATTAEVDAAVESLRSSGAIDAAEAAIADWASASRAALAAIPMDETARTEVDELVTALVGRAF